jgi:hypothetical protein
MITNGYGKAIMTKYLGPTNVRGSRVKAYVSDGFSVTLGYESALSSPEMHDKAAMALCEKMEWTGDMARGGTLTGYVYVFLR